MTLEAGRTSLSSILGDTFQVATLLEGSGEYVADPQADLAYAGADGTNVVSTTIDPIVKRGETLVGSLTDRVNLAVNHAAVGADGTIVDAPDRNPEDVHAEAVAALENNTPSVTGVDPKQFTI